MYGTEWPIFADVPLKNYSLTHCLSVCHYPVSIQAQVR